MNIMETLIFCKLTPLDCIMILIWIKRDYELLEYNIFSNISFS